MSEQRQTHFLRQWGKWYLQTSMLIGMPIVLALVLIGAQRFFFTFTCYTATFQCQYAFGGKDGSEGDMAHKMAAADAWLMDALRDSE